MAKLRIKAESWHKNRWCKIFGHIKDGYGGCVPYGRTEGGPVDGTGIEHPCLTVECDRCRQRVTVIRFHRKPNK